MFRVLISLLSLAAAGWVMAESQSLPRQLALPTENEALFRGDGSEFYQVIERNFRGVESRPWQGGQFGFVRDPVKTSAGVIYKRFHEGIDIRPMRRDARGEPLDLVRTIADGKVVHASTHAGYSNYGRYVVVEHRWGGSPYYSLYAHLNKIVVHDGEQVRRGDQLGVMGHTGAGIDRARSHVHVELDLMLSRHFNDWYGTFFRQDPNRHGLYNGMNLTGVNLANFFLASRKDASITMPEFVRREPLFYKVALPGPKPLDLIKMYPWLLTGTAPSQVKSWEVSFSQSGLPLQVKPSDRAVSKPELIYFKPSAVSYSYLTRGVLSGHGGRARLSESGMRLMRLISSGD